MLEVSQFLDKSLTDEQLDNICENVTFNNMRKNPNVNPDSEGGLGTNWKKSNANHLTFLRKGKLNFILNVTNVFLYSICAKYGLEK